MSQVPDDLKAIPQISSAFVADSNGVVLDTYDSNNASQLAAVGAYAAHSLKTVEDSLGMMDLTEIKVSGGPRTLMMNFSNEQIYVVEGETTLPCKMVSDFFENL